jgi:hypothetical protein
MSFRQAKSRKHVSLPIAGHTLVEIGRQPLVSLTFASANEIRSELQLEHEAVLTEPGGGTMVITASTPGPAFNRDAAYEALSSLLDKVVKAAIAHANGDLEITFYEGFGLHVHPDNYEAWHFQQPAPFPTKQYPKQHFSITGYGGGLLTFGTT